MLRLTFTTKTTHISFEDLILSMPDYHSNADAMHNIGLDDLILIFLCCDVQLNPGPTECNSPIVSQNVQSRVINSE